MSFYSIVWVQSVGATPSLGTCLWYTWRNMQTTVLNYRVIVEPDTQTGTGKPGFTALCPTLGVADDGDTIEEALTNVKGAIEAYTQAL